MIPARELARLALQVLKQLDHLAPLERDDVLHVAKAHVQVEIAQLNRPKPVKDE